MKNILIGAAISVMIVLSAGCGSKGVKLVTNAGDQFNLAKKEYDKEHWLKSIDGFQKVIFNFPGADIVDTAQFYLSMSYYNNKDYELGAVEFRRLMTNYPQSAYYDEAQFMSGMCYLKNTPGHYGLDQEDLKKAIQQLQDFIIDNPDSPMVEKAEKAINDGMTKLARKEYENGMLYFKLHQYKSAKIYFQYVIDNYTGTGYAAKSLFKLAEASFKQKEFTEALTNFNNFIAIYPENELVPKAEEFIALINRQMETVNVSEQP